MTRVTTSTPVETKRAARGGTCPKKRPRASTNPAPERICTMTVIARTIRMEVSSQRSIIR